MIGWLNSFIPDSIAPFLLCFYCCCLVFLWGGCGLNIEVSNPAITCDSLCLGAFVWSNWPFLLGWNWAPLPNMFKLSFMLSVLDAPKCFSEVYILFSINGFIWGFGLDWESYSLFSSSRFYRILRSLASGSLLSSDLFDYDPSWRSSWFLRGTVSNDLVFLVACFFFCLEASKSTDPLVSWLSPLLIWRSWCNWTTYGLSSISTSSS